VTPSAEGAGTAPKPSSPRVKSLDTGLLSAFEPGAPAKQIELPKASKESPISIATSADFSEVRSPRLLDNNPFMQHDNEKRKSLTLPTKLPQIDLPEPVLGSGVAPPLPQFASATKLPSPKDGDHKVSFTPIEKTPSDDADVAHVTDKPGIQVYPLSTAKPRKPSIKDIKRHLDFLVDERDRRASLGAAGAPSGVAGAIDVSAARLHARSADFGLPITAVEIMADIEFIEASAVPRAPPPTPTMAPGLVKEEAPPPPPPTPLGATSAACAQHSTEWLLSVSSGREGGVAAAVDVSDCDPAPEAPAAPARERTRTGTRRSWVSIGRLLPTRRQSAAQK